MTLSLKLKLVLLAVCISLWSLLFGYAMSQLSIASKNLEKEDRNVVMTDAWSYSSGNSRDGYEGRFTEIETGIELTHGIEAYQYHAYVKNPVPKPMVLALNKVKLKQADSSQLILASVSLFIASVSALIFFAVQVALLRVQRGFMYELSTCIYGGKRG